MGRWATSGEWSIPPTLNPAPIPGYPAQGSPGQPLVSWAMYVICRQGSLGLVHWGDPEGRNGEGGKRGAQDGEHEYTHGGFMLMHGKTMEI